MDSPIIPPLDPETRNLLDADIADLLLEFGPLTIEKLLENLECLGWKSKTLRGPEVFEQQVKELGYMVVEEKNKTQGGITVKYVHDAY
jgi:hypothetical protein